jgi:hypoxanthine phosphoribosyltransferase
MPALTVPGPVVFSEEMIAARVRELAGQISADTPGLPLHLVTVLRGGLLFMSDLARQLSNPSVTLDFLAVSRSPGQLPQLVKDLDTPLADRHVLLVEDVVNEGKTLQYILELLALRRPASLRVATMFARPARRPAGLQVDYAGLELPEDFVVGYGLDCQQRFRNLPYVARFPRTQGD